MYFVLRNSNKDMAKKGLILGVILMLPHFIITILVSSSNGVIFERTCEDMKYYVNDLKGLLSLAQFAGDHETIREYTDALREYNENCA